jgi:hypothetical protein
MTIARNAMKAMDIGRRSQVSRPFVGDRWYHAEPIDTPISERKKTK